MDSPAMQEQKIIVVVYFQVQATQKKVTFDFSNISLRSFPCFIFLIPPCLTWCLIVGKLSSLFRIIYCLFWWACFLCIISPIKINIDIWRGIWSFKIKTLVMFLFMIILYCIFWIYLIYLLFVFSKTGISYEIFRFIIVVFIIYAGFCYSLKRRWKKWIVIVIFVFLSFFSYFLFCSIFYYMFRV